ncbi:hypothetical protein LAZ40_10965 [Cereibacter sphaeroides]|uniref:hypothetical protein n=1 Tax=Cereibacter sphaeroides TaxID=1063 RepID=UPI001F170BD3|nr:hypothetical protein [Cereibacter sphaeroides]MCE6959576.1 hypothetical protein [Cereibacter sphaeroides]MCE6974564.1 hypothetical protein [Cereibacter sphaeroides]
MTRIVLWHGSLQRIERLDPASTHDGGVHLGTLEQARMRNSAFLHEVEVTLGRCRRSRDRGGDWKGRIMAARAAGFDAIVYLNRYEGLATEVIERLQAQGLLGRLDGLSDAAFRRHVPEARDSYILLRPDHLRILSIRTRDTYSFEQEGPTPCP